MKLFSLIMLIGFFAKAVDMKPYLGANLGLASLQGTNNESTKNGYLLGVKGLVSFDLGKWTLDTGLGYYSQELSNSQLYIRTKTGTVDVDLRYKLPSCEVGLGIRSDLGTDNSGTEYVGSKSQSNSLFAKAVFTDKWDKYPVRYEFGLGTSVGQARTLTTAFVGIQIGLPDDTPKLRSVSQVKTLPEVKVAQSHPSKTDFKVDLKVAKILFNTNKFTLDDKAKAKLANLGKYLAKNNNLWDRVKVGGHTDSMGDNVKNKILSQDRADAVAKILVENGVDEKKIVANGYGSQVPVAKGNNESSLQQNRRTEVEFFGVTNRQVLNVGVLSVLKGNDNGKQ